jgi:hypothetical protein
MVAIFIFQRQRLILFLRHGRKLMPKLYHGKACGVDYSIRAVGFWRRYPFFFAPYLTGDVVRLHLKLKYNLDWWPQAILRIDPPDMSKEPLWEGGPLVSLSDYAFEIPQIEQYKSWSQTLALKNGDSFGQPCNVKCFVDLQKIDGDKVTSCSLHVADIEIVSRGPFITNILMWVFSLIASGIIGYFIAIITRN